jgi:hypothetical protein
VISEPPSQKITNTAALFSGLDKTPAGHQFRRDHRRPCSWRAQLPPRARYTRPPTETANTDASSRSTEVTLQGEVRRIFNG